MPNTTSTDDFYTYNDHGTPYMPATTCRCMYHHGETPNPVCFDPEVTAANRAILAAE